jgi:hypothetical protein
MKRWPTRLLGEIVSIEYGKALKAEERSANGHYPVYGSNGVVGFFDRAIVKEPTIVLVSRITHFEGRVIALFHGLPAGISGAL